MKSYVARHGPEALIPSRKEPFSALNLSTILRLSNGTRIGTRTLDWSSFFFASFKALLCVGLAAGFRKAELCTQDGGSFVRGHLSRASVAWRIGGIMVAKATCEQLRNLQPGDCAAIRPPTCKNDPFGQWFSDKAIWLPFNDSPVNAAKALAELFAMFPGGTKDWDTTPLFCMDDNGSPLCHLLASDTFQALLRAAFPREDTSKWSLHSLRIGCATALLAAGASPELIQALCRWRSPHSAAIYARLGPSDYCQWVNCVEKQRIDAVSAKRIFDIRLDADAFVAALNGPELRLLEHDL